MPVNMMSKALKPIAAEPPLGETLLGETLALLGETLLGETLLSMVEQYGIGCWPHNTFGPLRV